MTTELTLERQLAEALGRSYCVLCGRGTTALWLALRAIRRRDGPGEVIMPDLLCAMALEGVLLAGFKPVFADVLPGRFTLSPSSVAQLVTPRTRAILVVHLFGHVAAIDLIRQAAPGIPLIEDAVQGFGGYFKDKPVGSWGDVSFISFDQNKMIGGRGGALLWDDASLVDGIETDLRRLPDLPDLGLAALDGLLPPAAAAAYAFQLRTFAPALLRSFDSSSPNLDRILADWKTLGPRVEERNAKACWMETHLAGLPLALPEIHEGDAIWRYTITAPTVALAWRMMRGLQSAGLSGSGLYYPLSRFLGQQAGAGRLTNRLVNLWVDEATDRGAMQRTVDAISAVPWSQALPT
ncbi:MAG TPA: DegT/DnrJ/EryC1/StrS family aminotransferase [Aggregatilineaceae bacterium]|nr:DegT/DnrJ/EryC1/StrS family aminotransferase [Aggregatilineaceae bacterium]